MVGKRTLNRPGSRPKDQAGNGDLESGLKQRRFGGFKDAVEYVVERRTTAALKDQLRKGVLRGAFENARKSDEEVRLHAETRRGGELTCCPSVESHQEQEGPQVLREAKCRLGRLGRSRHDRPRHGRRGDGEHEHRPGQ